MAESDTEATALKEINRIAIKSVSEYLITVEILTKESNKPLLYQSIRRWKYILYDQKLLPLSNGSRQTQKPSFEYSVGVYPTSESLSYLTE